MTITKMNRLNMELNWDNANSWAKLANEDKYEVSEPIWSFDCGFKLDFDGPILRVSSRFYPPNRNDGIHWEGEVQILILDVKIAEKKIRAKTLDAVKRKAESFVKQYTKIVKSKLLEIK